ncbi:helix-turn-helix domain-containing protein [Sphingomonas montanisoli]|uniref:Helix-turn-helix domain-containing protein n=1 Tax=Sphingomonas montanisoli TaxID=2606412 RepID=A0A5D9CFW6_9SPHN|nr:helix-turn-helix transcriptional regulator [Sphingomonas montanisoli]TZG28955.1 helix-turn-helix domain-containing protein [Sphingomonas montanisoli]
MMMAARERIEGVRRGNVDSGRMLAQLKRLFHAAGLRYADVAKEIGVSEKTMKRYMSGRGLTVAALERICAVVDTDLLELAELAVDAEAVASSFLTSAQESALAENQVMGLTFYLLSKGWSVDRIGHNLQLSESEMTFLLTKLDKIGVIALYPANRVKLRASLRPFAQLNEQMVRSVQERWRKLFADMDFTDPHTICRSGLTRLSEESFAKADELFNHFMAQLFALGDKDRNLPHEKVSWYATGAVMRSDDIVGRIHDVGSFPPMLDGAFLRR